MNRGRAGAPRSPSPPPGGGAPALRQFIVVPRGMNLGAICTGACVRSPDLNVFSAEAGLGHLGGRRRPPGLGVPPLSDRLRAGRRLPLPAHRPLKLPPALGLRVEGLGYVEAARRSPPAPPHPPAPPAPTCAGF